MPAPAQKTYFRRRRPIGAFIDAALILVLGVYLFAAWRVRAVGMRLEAVSSPTKVFPGRPCLGIDTHLTDPARSLEILLYRRVGGLHLLEYRTHLAPVGMRLRFVYPVEDSDAAYMAVLQDEKGRWARMTVTARPSKPSVPSTLRLHPAPAAWFL